MSPSARQSDSPIHKFRLTQPRKSDQINTEAWYIHSAQPSAERGYVLKEWFKPTKAQIASLKHARVARAGYWIRESAFHVRVAFKCCITNCAFCKQATGPGINPEDTVEEDTREDSAVVFEDEVPVKSEAQASQPKTEQKDKVTPRAKEKERSGAQKD